MPGNGKGQRKRKGAAKIETLSAMPPGLLSAAESCQREVGGGEKPSFHRGGQEWNGGGGLGLKGEEVQKNYYKKVVPTVKASLFERKGW